MKKLFTSVFSLLYLYCLLPAQNFVPLGTTWHYSGVEFSPFWECCIYEKDTLFGGKNHMKISILRQGFGWMGVGTPWVPGSPEYITRYFYQSADTVYEREQNGTYRILFVFNVPVGDSWETWPSFEENPGCIVHSRTQVLDTGSVQINGRTLRYWDIGPTDSSFMAMEGRLIEQIGPTGRGWYPKIYSSSESNHCAQGIYENIMSIFTCFESDSIGFYNIPHWPYSECEFNFSLGETAGSAVRVFPNPVTDILYIDAGPGVFDIDILDMQGRVQRTLRQQIPGAGIPFGEFPSGIYMACIKRSGYPDVWHKIVKN